MNSIMGRIIAPSVRRALFIVACGALTAGAAHSQGTGGPGGNAGSCTVTQLRMTFATGDDDLRGGRDNLNIVVYFTNRTSQIALNVNGSNPWHNNSVNLVPIDIKPPVPPNEIRAFRLVHMPDGGFSLNIPELATPAGPIVLTQALAKLLQSPDNWNMADMEVSALGNGVGAQIATHGYHRFTGSNPDLIIGAHIPANICGSGRPTGNNGGQGEVSGGNSSGGSGMLLALRPQGMLAPQPKSSVLLQDNRTARNVTPAMAAPNATRSASKSSGGPNTGAGIVAGKPLTNQDVVTMLGQRVQEQAIIQRLQTSASAFDVSNAARAAFDRECLAKKPANESAGRWAAEVKNIWDTMMNVVICQQTNGRGGEGACGPSSGASNGNSGAGLLSGQPHSPTGSPNAIAGAGAKPAKNFVVPQNVKIVAGTEVKNPAALASSMRMAMPQGQPGNIGPSHTMSAPGGGGTGSQMASAARPIMRGPAAVGPTGGTPNKYGVAPANGVLHCAQGPPRISTVTEMAPGKAATQQVVFTPDIDTEYVISGCGFGNTPGQIYLTGGFQTNGGKVAMVPFHPFTGPITGSSGTSGGWEIHWTDEQIEASVDSNVSGELDEGSVTLVIEPAGGAPLQAGWGFDFYARRGSPVMLPQIPQSAFSHDTVFAAFGGYSSPGGAWMLKNTTVEVLRAGNFNPSYGYSITPDVFTINLKPGFVIYSVSGAYAATPNSVGGKPYRVSLSGNQVVVNYPMAQITAQYWFSLYGLKVFVVGPIGVSNPWAGQ